MIQALLAAAPAVMEALPALTGAAEGAGAAAGASSGGGAIGGMMKNLAGGQFSSLLGGEGGQGGGMPNPTEMATNAAGGALDMLGNVAKAGFNQMLPGA